MYHGHIRSIFSINYLASSLHIKKKNPIPSLPVMVLDTLQPSPMFFKFLCPMRRQICVIFFFLGVG